MMWFIIKLCVSCFGCYLGVFGRSGREIGDLCEQEHHWSVWRRLLLYVYGRRQGGCLHQVVQS